MITKTIKIELKKLVQYWKKNKLTPCLFKIKTSSLNSLYKKFIVFFILLNLYNTKIEINSNKNKKEYKLEEKYINIDNKNKL